MVNLGSIFGKSPFAPLQAHMEKAVESVESLKAYFEAMSKDNPETLETLKQQILDAEKAADQIKNNIRNHLPRSLFLPIDRRELLNVLEFQDSIADTSQDIVELLELRQMILPPSLYEAVLEFIGIVEKTCLLSLEISQSFANLVETGFGTHTAENLHELIQRLSDMEDDADVVESNANKLLFHLEEQMKPVDVVFWYEVFKWIGNLADYCKKIANRIRLMVAR